MKDADDTRSKVCVFIHFGGYARTTSWTDRKRQSRRERINAESFGDGKNTVSVNTSNKFAEYMKRMKQVVFISTGWIETLLQREGTNFMEPQQAQPYMTSP